MLFPTVARLGLRPHCHSTLAIDQKPRFPAVLLLQAGNIGIVRYERAEVLDFPGKPCALRQMLGSVAVMLCSCIAQREIDHRPERESCGQRYGGDKKFVMVAVKLGLALDQQCGGLLKVRPREKEVQC